MGMLQDITQLQRNAIITTLASGKFKIPQIAGHYGVSTRTVQSIKATGTGIQSGRVGRCGLKRNTSAAEHKIIVRHAIARPRDTHTQHQET